MPNNVSLVGEQNCYWAPGESYQHPDSRSPGGANAAADPADVRGGRESSTMLQVTKRTESELINHSPTSRYFQVSIEKQNVVLFLKARASLKHSIVIIQLIFEYFQIGFSNWCSTQLNFIYKVLEAAIAGQCCAWKEIKHKNMGNKIKTIKQ